MLALVRRLPWHVRDMATAQWAAAHLRGGVRDDRMRRRARGHRDGSGPPLRGARHARRRGPPARRRKAIQIAATVFSPDELPLAVRAPTTCS